MVVNIRKRKRKNGFSYTVYIDYGIVDGIRKREFLETFENKKVAESYKSKIQTQIDNNTFINIPDISFSDAIDEWMNNYVKNNCEPNTEAGYEVINNKYLKPCLGHIPFKVISSPQGIDLINDYFKYLRFELSNETNTLKTGEIKQKRNLSYSTVEHHKAQISGIFTYFMSIKKLANNICFNTIIPKSDDEKGLDVIVDNVEDFDDNFAEFDEIQGLSLEQSIVVLKLFMNTDIMLPVCLAMFLGLRRSEALGILKNRVDLLQNRIIIDATTVRSKRKIIFKRRNKNKTSRRCVYIPKVLMYFIKLDLKRQYENKLLLGNNYFNSKFLCVYDDGKPLNPDYVSRKFVSTIRQYVKLQTSINPNFEFPHVTYHTLRHLNINLLLENNAVLSDVKEFVGHSDIDTTIRYTYETIQSKKEISEKIDEIYQELLNAN